MALHLARPKQRLHSNPSLIHLFSTSSSSSSSSSSSLQDGNEQPSQSPPPSDFKVSSYLSSIRSSLNQNQKPFLSGNQIGVDSNDARRNLSEFRRRSEAPTPRDFQDLYKQKVLSKSGDSNANQGNRKIEGVRFESIRENIRQMRQGGNTTPLSNLSSFQSIKNSRLSENLRSNVIGGNEGLSFSVLGDDVEEGKNDSEEMKSEFLRSYDTKELGEKLRLYRPEGKKEEGWFSLQELNQRLVKLRELEEEQEAQRMTKIKGGGMFMEMRSTIVKAKEEAAKKTLSLQKFDFLSVLNGTPKYLQEPPKEQLVETYFHPDNMSSAEKMKIELAKVREEFKMSESDCGSARVQVAQLTTKIKHLSSVLHKKDKHSRKGLIAMVQRRKKLLKYMRRTDWDSYCLSLSKLGLRDNPDYKF